MAGGLVNLDALIPRADFAYDPRNPPNPSPFLALKTHDLVNGSPTLFRKPDFQRETSHWSPDKVRDLVLAFANEDLVPSVILWRSARNEAFVIDGAHRLSSLIAWVNNDYGDNGISKAFFGQEIPLPQLKAAQKARDMINASVGPYAEISEAHRVAAFEKYKDLATRLGFCSVSVQTLGGDADKAETSFFRINKQGVKLDSTELTLLYSRNCPNAVAARAISQNGAGHPHWKQFETCREEIESVAKETYQIYFTPALNSTVVKTSEVPIAGRQTYPEVLSMLLNSVNIANGIGGTIPNDRAHAEQLVPPDVDGSKTVEMLKKVRRIAQRIHSDAPCSLGLDPFVYFYSTGGRHQPSSFLAVYELLADFEEKDTHKEFTRVRAAFEEFLVLNSAFIPQVTRKARGELRGVNALKKYFGTIIEGLRLPGASISVVKEGLLASAEYKYLKPVAYEDTEYGQDFSAEVMSGVPIIHHLQTALRCGVCRARLDYRAISYDHRTDKKHEGNGDPSNVSATHRFCNSAKDALVPYFGSHGGIVPYVE